MSTTEQPLHDLNALPDDEAHAALLRCCGASRWVTQMKARRPFASEEALFANADAVWATMERDDILEAFTHHPRIGADLDKLRAKFTPTKGWSGQEQQGVATASEETLCALRDGNVDYETRFGFIFIVCATGKSADAMLALLQARIGNDPSDELAIAAAEQAKITKIRLRKLIS